MNCLLLLSYYTSNINLGENGAIENIQVTILLMTMLIFSYHYFKYKLKYVAFIGFTICFAFIFRELDVEKFNIPNILILLGSGIGRNIIVALLIMISLYLFWKYFDKDDLRHLFSNFLYIPILSVILLLLSSVFDQNIIHLQYNLLFEELFETNAYLLILITSINFYQKFRIR